ncbi:MAG TPA: hypothetical protein PLZ93_08075 [Nocardioides sp.]|uniref:hypothetical protein n=1 Tax=uncultured Nocardioides sp. TaxID=198441 RepID=UPI000EDB4030|nr:hypothetical protein [uncultured Nocardioides sp.]HCB05504.1 hypothetical protein [Nocardioides sp.]HRD63981.1 hypothetical protein [Nocardioides sp.]HRI95557.1 hypothetical protein [Nocardioides sp.]HRK45914.1 hypothetical protein [Nocardioides sp.]
MRSERQLLYTLFVLLVVLTLFLLVRGGGDVPWVVVLMACSTGLLAFDAHQRGAREEADGS